MQKIFVTGAAGFIGSNLVDRLLAAGHRAGSATVHSYFWTRRKCAPSAPQLSIREGVLRTLQWLQGNRWILERRQLAA
jgi:nucleoside-diphosphate-sugar epimerase